jgi:SAM-dependent methyltransferase
MNELVFEKYSDYYDLIYKEKNYNAEAKYIHSLINKHGKNFRDILEFGSGTGKHAGIFTELGYKIHGIELSKYMVSKAKIVPGFTCQEGDIANTKMNKTYNVVLSLFHVMSYQITNKQLNDVFSNAAAHLNKDGLFIFDFWYSPAVYTEKPAVRVKRVANKEIEITRIAEPKTINNKNRIDISYTLYIKNLLSGKVDIIKEIHSVRHFSLPEIDILCEMFGFKRILAEEFKTGKKIDEHTWGPCVLLKKIK